MKKGKLIVISGPSGVGKDTIVNEYLKENNASLSVSATTRKPRENEKHKVHYYFLTNDEFEEKINNDEFLEYAKYNNCYYGTLKEEVEGKLEKGIDVILVIEVQGALNIKNQMNDAVLIFIMPPSIEELKRRLESRNLDSAEMIDNRLKIALTEIDKNSEYDYIVINDEINAAVNEIKEIINKESIK